MRILLVNDRPPGPGSGVEVHLSLLIDELRAAGDEVEVLTASEPHTGARRILDAWDPGARRRLELVAGAFHPDVVHHHNVLRELSPSVLGVPRGVPSVLTIHDHRIFGAPDAGAPARARAALVTVAGCEARAIARRRVSTVVALADPTVAALRAAGFERVERLELFAADPGPPSQPAGDGTDVVFAGRLAPDKGAGQLAEAFTRVAPRHPAARLVLAGDGPDRPRLEAVAARLPGRVVLTGAVGLDTVHGLMATARLVAAPSVQALRPETGPQTVLEAALRARPVVVPADVPLASLVRGSDGGIVVPPSSVDALAEALDALLADPDRATAAGQRARAFALAHHTPAVVVPKLRSVYGRLAGVGVR